MTEIYTIEYDNGESYEDHHTSIDSQFFETREEAVKYLNFNHYHLVNDKYFGSRFDRGGAEIITLTKADTDYTVEPLDISKYDSLGLKVKDYNQAGSGYEIFFEETVVDGVKVEAFSVFSGYEDENIEAFSMVKEYLSKLKEDIKVDKKYYLVFSGIEYGEPYQYSNKEWFIKMDLINRETNESEDENYLTINKHFDNEEYEYQRDLINSVLE